MTRMLRYKSNTLELGADGIIRFRPEADDVYSDTDLIMILDLAEQLSEGDRFLLLMLINEYEFLMTKEARKLFNTYEKAQRLIKAEAVVVNSVSTRILFNLLNMVHRPKFPFRAFTTEKEASTWLTSIA